MAYMRFKTCKQDLVVRGAMGRPLGLPITERTRSGALVSKTLFHPRTRLQNHPHMNSNAQHRVTLVRPLGELNHQREAPVTFARLQSCPSLGRSDHG